MREGGGGGLYRLLLCLAKGLESFLLPCTIFDVCLV